MAAPLLTDPRLKHIYWKDLMHLTRREVAWEVTLSLPWLIGSLVLAAHQLFIPALFCSFFFFLTGLRQSHNAQHQSVGISARATEWMLFALSATMLASMHAVKFNHLRHHKDPLGEMDVEARSARMPGWMAILAGPILILQQHSNALQKAHPNLKRWVVLEIITIGLVVTTALWVIDVPWITYHVLVMLTGECFSAFFAVWTVHHDCADELVFSRTIRGKWRTRIFYNMFYHTEHHLFPKVPTCHLQELAKRIDEHIPEISKRTVL